MKHSSYKRSFIYVASVAFVMGLGSIAVDAGANTSATTAKTKTSTVTETTTSRLSDNQIAKVVETANDGEIDAAKAALKRATNPRVKAYAQRMIDDHDQNNSDVGDLAKRINLSTEKSEKSNALKESAENSTSAIKNLEGAAFDKAYMDLQVSMHSQLLDDLNKKLIPSAQNPELKEFLEATKGRVQSHLKEAKHIQTALAK